MLGLVGLLGVSGLFILLLPNNPPTFGTKFVFAIGSGCRCAATGCAATGGGAGGAAAAPGCPIGRAIGCAAAAAAAGGAFSLCDCCNSPGVSVNFLT